MNYNNYFLGLKPSSSHALYIMAPIPISAMSSYMKTSTGLPIGHRRNKLIFSYSLNMKSIAEAISTYPNYNGRSAINFEAYQYAFQPLFVSSFDDDAGSGIYKRLPTYFPLTVDNNLVYSEHKYDSNFVFSPLVSDSGINYQLPAEKILYKASVLPLYPLVLASSIESHITYGPSLLRSFNISLSAKNSIPMVNINCSLVGTKYVEVSQPQVPFTPYIEEKELIFTSPAGSGGSYVSYSGSGILTTESNKDFSSLYRSATIIDSLIDINYTHPSISSLKKKLFSKNNINNVTRARIIEFSMSIDNSIDFIYTQPTDGAGLLDDNVGATFAELSSRTVTGTVTFYSTTNYIKSPGYQSGMTLYFGGPFFYPLLQVNWGHPTVEIVPGGGYTHKYKFTAKINPKTGFYNNTGAVSEFNVSTSYLNSI